MEIGDGHALGLSAVEYFKNGSALSIAYARGRTLTKLAWGAGRYEGCYPRLTSATRRLFVLPLVANGKPLTIMI